MPKLMDIRKIKKLIELLEDTDISEIEVREGEESIRLSRHNYPMGMGKVSQHPSIPTIQSAPVVTHYEKPPENIQTENLVVGHKIRSPMVGTIYMSPAPDKPPFVSIGQSVTVGEPLCIIEAMKMFNEIESDKTGKIIDILVTNGDPVEYDQVLFIIE